MVNTPSVTVYFLAAQDLTIESHFGLPYIPVLIRRRSVTIAQKTLR